MDLNPIRKNTALILINYGYTFTDFLRNQVVPLSNTNGANPMYKRHIINVNTCIPMHIMWTLAKSSI